MSWVVLEEFPDYEINSEGKVRRCGANFIQKGRIVGVNKEIKYIFLKDGKKFERRAHELVAQTFLSNPNGWTKIIFKDGNHQNCSVENLEWIEEDSEQWDELNGFPEYEINRKGQLRNKKTKKLIGQNSDASGYNPVNLRKDGKIHRRYIHVLVANQYVENPEGKSVINHIDQNRANNSVENLEWVTTQENCRHGNRGELIGKHRAKPVNEYDLDGKYIRTWISGAAFERHYGLQISSSQAVLRHGGKTIAGRQLRYYEGSKDDISAAYHNKRKNSREYDYEKPVPSESLYVEKSEHELVIEAIEMPLKQSLSGKTRERNAALIKAYIEKLENEIERLKAAENKKE